MIEIFYLSVTTNLLFMYVVRSMRYGIENMYLDSLQACKHDGASLETSDFDIIGILK